MPTLWRNNIGARSSYPRAGPAGQALGLREGPSRYPEGPRRPQLAGKDLVREGRSPAACRGDQRHVWGDARGLFWTGSTPSSRPPEGRDAGGPSSYSRRAWLVWRADTGRRGTRGGRASWSFRFRGCSPAGGGQGSQCRVPRVPRPLQAEGGGRIFQPRHAVCTHTCLRRLVCTRVPHTRMCTDMRGHVKRRAHRDKFAH